MHCINGKKQNWWGKKGKRICRRIFNIIFNDKIFYKKIMNYKFFAINNILLSLAVLLPIGLLVNTAASETIVILLSFFFFIFLLSKNNFFWINNVFC